MPELQNPDGCVVAISWAPGYEKPARFFAREHSLPIINELPLWRGLCFELTAAGWVLRDLSGDSQKPFALQFESRYAAQGKDPLLKAMGKADTVLDLTAGWGGDAIHIARFGCHVVSVERNPVVFQLLVQALERLDDTELAARLKFLHLDAARPDFSSQLVQARDRAAGFDLVYLDPMFAAKPASRAKTKKPMRLIQKLADRPSEINEQRLFENALAIADNRVVVKRSIKAPYICARKPQGSIRSKLLRFDLYLP